MMKPIDLKDVRVFVEQNIGSFHKSRLDSLTKLKLNDIVKRKNPYLYKAKNILISGDLVKTILDAHLSSQEETIFGDFLEGLAIYINGKVYDGRKSSAVGIDLEFEKEEKRYIIAIKSGPHWGNSQQISRMRDNFIKAKRILRTSNSRIEVIAVNGCCYGKDNNPDKGDYFKLCGQRLWEFISGNGNLYPDIIEPLGYRAKEKNEEFFKQYAQIINMFTADFCDKFCINGDINWEALVRFNSSSI